MRWAGSSLPCTRTSSGAGAVPRLRRRALKEAGQYGHHAENSHVVRRVDHHSTKGSQSMSLASDLWNILTRPQRRRVLAAQIISVAMAFSTVTGIAAIAPFFAVLGAPRLIDDNGLLHWLYVHGDFSTKRG